MADEIRQHTQAISERWERAVLEAEPTLAALSRPSLIDHLPEFLRGLADWVEGETLRAREGFRLLAEGHALNRLNAGVNLELLTMEYGILRGAILDELNTAVDAETIVASIAALDAGIDCAIFQAVQRYATGRDAIRERFISILAHDLRDPLAAIRMSSELLGASVVQPSEVELVAKIQRGATRIERMIDDVLDFARAKLGEGIPIEIEAVDLGTLATQAARESLAVDPTRPVRTEIASDLLGMFDPERIHQALANMLANARTYGTGEIVVGAWASADRMHCYLTVGNQGSVIPEATLGRIFDPFERGLPVKRKGLGLGLFIVQQITLAHGGACHVTSSAAEGTTFMLELPRVPLDQTPGRG